MVIVGSGPAGVHAAYPLVKEGLKVAMIDGGLDSNRQEQLQDDFSNSNLTATSPAYDLIKRSSYVFNKTYQLLNISSKIEIIQSLARGGLSEIWGGACDFFSNDELESIGVPPKEIQKEYPEIAKSIKLEEQTNLDLHGRLILQAAKGQKNPSFKIYQLPMASSYRARKSLDNLKKNKNFTYIPNQLVFTAKKQADNVEIQSFSIDRGEEIATMTRFLILAAGSINTTRILLRSFNLFNYKTTFLTKPHYMTACLHLKTLGKTGSVEKLNLGQVGILGSKHKGGLASFFIQFYRFNPKMLYKSIKFIPLPKSLALILLSTIASSLVIADIRFPAFESKKKFCVLKKIENGRDVLEISFEETDKELTDHKKMLNKIAQQLRSLGLFPLKTVSDYVTSHYAGGIPIQGLPAKLSVDINGRLYRAREIYVADSSTWRSLPAEPPALTIMANASRVGKKVLKNFHK